MGNISESKCYLFHGKQGNLFLMSKHYLEEIIERYFFSHTD